MRIFISAPMTGLPNFNREAICAVAERLRKAGHEAYHTAGLPDGWPYDDYIQYSCRVILGCDAILLMPGWRESRGVGIELAYASQLGIPAFEEVPPVDN